MPQGAFEEFDDKVVAIDQYDLCALL